MTLPDGAPKRVSNFEFTEAMPAWSPDGSQLVWSTWEGDGGHLYKMNFQKQKVQNLSALLTLPDCIPILHGRSREIRLYSCKAKSLQLQGRSRPGFICKPGRNCVGLVVTVETST